MEIGGSFLNMHGIMIYIGRFYGYDWLTLVVRARQCARVDFVRKGLASYWTRRHWMI